MEAAELIKSGEGCRISVNTAAPDTVEVMEEKGWSTREGSTASSDEERVGPRRRRLRGALMGQGNVLKVLRKLNSVLVQTLKDASNCMAQVAVHRSVQDILNWELSAKGCPVVHWTCTGTYQPPRRWPRRIAVEVWREKCVGLPIHHCHLIASCPCHHRPCGNRCGS